MNSTTVFVGARLYVHLVKISALHRVAGPLRCPRSEVYKGHDGGFPRAVHSVDSRIAKQRTTEGKGGESDAVPDGKSK